jgi:hypothetical protein
MSVDTYRMTVRGLEISSLPLTYSTNSPSVMRNMILFVVPVPTQGNTCLEKYLRIWISIFVRDEV